MRERPQAFRLDDPRVVLESGLLREDLPHGAVVIAADALEGEDLAGTPPPRRRGTSWGTLFWSALGALVSLGIGLAVDELVRELFARAEWLGWTGVALAGLLSLAVFAMALRELVGFLRLARIHRLRDDADAAIANDDPAAARSVARALLTLYEARPETARGRRLVVAQLPEIVDAVDLLAIAERELLAPFDAEALRLVLDSSKRVSVVTALSPRALLDVLFVGFEGLRLMRRLATLYGGRPGTLGLLRLAREVVAHLAATGAIALGDGIVQQVLGHGLAARLSARLGEGVVNGLLTARVGLACIAVCRPLPFVRAKPPRIGDIMQELVRFSRSPVMRDDTGGPG